MRAHTKEVAATVSEFIQSMRSGSVNARIRRYMKFLFDLDDLKWVAPRHAEAFWDAWRPTCQELAKVLIPQYQSTMLKPGADKIRCTAYLLGHRSRFWPRFKAAFKEFPRLPRAYWVKTVSPWYEHNSMPYVRIRGRVVFWPGLDTLADTYRELDDTLDNLAALKRLLAVGKTVG